mgnify:CR=1 FL=1
MHSNNNYNLKYRDTHTARIFLALFLGPYPKKRVQRVPRTNSWRSAQARQ